MTIELHRISSQWWCSFVSISLALQSESGYCISSCISNWVSLKKHSPFWKKKFTRRNDHRRYPIKSGEKYKGLLFWISSYVFKCNRMHCVLSQWTLSFLDFVALGTTKADSFPTLTVGHYCNHCYQTTKETEKNGSVVGCWPRTDHCSTPVVPYGPHSQERFMRAQPRVTPDSHGV